MEAGIPIMVATSDPLLEDRLAGLTNLLFAKPREPNAVNFGSIIEEDFHLHIKVDGYHWILASHYSRSFGKGVETYDAICHLLNIRPAGPKGSGGVHRRSST